VALLQAYPIFGKPALPFVFIRSWNVWNLDFACSMQYFICFAFYTQNIFSLCFWFPSSL